jgi:hypothetical protein
MDIAYILETKRRNDAEYRVISFSDVYVPEIPP